MKIVSISNSYNPIFGKTNNAKKSKKETNNNINTANIMLGTGSVMTAALIGLTISGKKGHGPLKNLFNKNIDIKA